MGSTGPDSRTPKGGSMKLRDDEVEAIRDKAEMEFRTGRRYIAWRDADTAGIIDASMWVRFQHSYSEVTELTKEVV